LEDRLHRLICGLLLIVAGLSTSSAEGQPYRAGVTRMTVERPYQFDILIAYPTEAAEGTVQFGPFPLTANRDAPISTAQPFPIVLFSHGGGQRPGTPWLHRELLLQLAREGYVVIAPFHPGAPAPIVARPRQMRLALDAVAADSRFAAQLDRSRIAMMGFSFGGAVALISAGGMPNLARLSAYCRDVADRRACGGIPTDNSWANIPPRRSADVLPLKALILLDPFGALFDRDGLASLDMPVLIYHALRSDLRIEGNAQAVAGALPRPPRHLNVPGSHFVFVDPCPPDLAAVARELCADPPGVDRAAVHRDVRREIAEFLRQHLQPDFSPARFR
jgi:predicted dienelactone hydrolase